jgi:hypothetical protein
MGWIDDYKKKKGTLPKELEGKTDDDVLVMLADATKAKEERDQLKVKVAEQDTAVANIQTEFEKVKTKLQEAEANRNKQTPKGDNNNDEPADFVTDPDKAFGQRIGPLASVALQTAAVQARMLAQQQLNNMDAASNGRQMDGRLFAMWGNEIDAEAKKYQTIHLGNVAAWTGIFYYVKGLHSDELRDPETRKKKYNFLESASSSATTQNNDQRPKPDADTLTDAEKHVADKMGVSHENYAKRKKSMQFVGA